MLVQHKVKDFAAWKKVFDSVAAMRKASGELSTQLFRDTSDPNKVTVLNRWDTLANAQKFAQSPDLKAAMEKGGVEGPPTVTFLNEA